MRLVPTRYIPRGRIGGFMGYGDPDQQVGRGRKRDSRVRRQLTQIYRVSTSDGCALIKRKQRDSITTLSREVSND